MQTCQVINRKRDSRNCGAGTRK